MKKILSIILIILLSAVAVFAFGVLDGDPRDSGVSNSPGSDDPNTPYLVTEGSGCRPPINRPGPNNPPLRLQCHSMVVQMPATGQTYQVRIGLGMLMDAPVQHDDTGTYAFYLYIDTPLADPVMVVYTNQTTGATYMVTLDAGSTCCWVPVGDPLGPWMVQFGVGNYGFFTVTSELFYSGISF